MRKVWAGTVGVVLVAALTFVSGGVSRAATDTNVQDGNNTSRTHQTGSGQSGSSIGGQVSGVVSGGRTSVDATNNSSNSSVQTGDATGNNSARSFTGLNNSNVKQVNNGAASSLVVANNQTGDNTSTITQSSSAVTGDGVAGQVIGAVTSGGSSSIVASNTSTNVDVTTGDANATNDAHAFVGLNASDITNTSTAIGCTRGSCFTPVTVTAAVSASNNQDGDNRGRVSQSSNATTGDGVAGQVIGAVTSGGASSIDARNTSDNVSVTTGDADSANRADAFVGLNIEGVTNTAQVFSSAGASFGRLVATVTATVANNQTGDNHGTVNQRATAVTGDGVGGQVIGAVTSGGSSSIVAANTSRNSDITTGDAHASNDHRLFVGLDISGVNNFDSVTGCLADCFGFTVTSTAVLNASNTQTGDNHGTSNATANATTGDGVGGQVIGAVTSGGASSIDAGNVTDNVSVTTGDAHSRNSGDSFVGLNIAGVTNTNTAEVCFIECAFDTTTITNQVSVANTQDGDNHGTSTQAANATSGDGVGGEVIGAVTSGGSSSIVAANTTTNSDITTGDARSSNDGRTFVGLDASGISNSDSVTGCFALCTTTIAVNNAVTVRNDQTGDNHGTSAQAANATSGDGVGGQVIGAVTSGGASSIDARNRTDNTSVTTGDARANNGATMFVGLNAESVTNTDRVLGCLIGCGGTFTISNAIDVTNTQDGDNHGTSTQAANATSGDGVGGEVIGAVTSGGSSSIVAANTTTNSDITTGDARSSNDGRTFVGLDASGISNSDSVTGCIALCTTTAVVNNAITVRNDQTGDNRVTAGQTANAVTGDGVGGQVIGAVTSGGASSIDANNLTDDSSLATGDAHSDNHANTAVGLNISGVSSTARVLGCFIECVVTVTALSTITAVNAQTGDNRGTVGQTADATTGDGVGGEVIGAVTSGGTSSIVAANTTRTTDVTTGDAHSSNSATLFAGQNLSGISNFDSVTGCTADCTGAATVTAVANVSNNQTGDNRGTIGQAANASTGDGVGGQVIGAVTSAGASSIDASNRTEDTTVATGDSDAANSARAFVGLEVASVTNVATATGEFGPALAVATTTASNVQNGDNRRTTGQTANAVSGDAVGGQVIGAVTSGGATSVVLANTTTGGDFESGHAVEDNSDSTFVGLLALPLVGL